MPIDIPLREISSGPSSHDPEIAEEGCPNDEADVVRLQGEPVIRTGRDISHFLVDLRDDGDPALTFRSLAIGSLFAGMYIVNYQVSDIPACYVDLGCYSCDSPASLCLV